MADQGSRLRVGIDGFNLALSRGTGVATYARVLSRGIAGLGHPVDALYGVQMPRGTAPDMREVLFFDRMGEERTRRPPWPATPGWLREQAESLRGYDALPVPISGRVISAGLGDRLPSYDRILNIPGLFERANRHFRQFRRFLRVRMPDPPAIMHWTYPLPIRLDGARNVYTLHDLVPLRLPYTTLDNKNQYNRLIRACLRDADHICTVSEASRRDILDIAPEAAPKVTNTYESFDPPPAARLGSDEELDAQLRGIFGLKRRGYFLFFGSLEPKKNIGRLLEAYLSSCLDTPLVLVGAQAWKSEQELRLLNATGRAGGAGVGRNVIQIEYLPFAMLMTLIRGARAVTFPSLYEGFGLPVLEAMALGTPSLTSRTSSLPEIAGDAALLVDPYDVREIAAGLRRLDEDAELRADLAARGEVQAAKFRMAVYQERLAAMYAAVLHDDRTQPRA